MTRRANWQFKVQKYYSARCYNKRGYINKRWTKIELKIDASELKSEGKETIKNLADFIKNKTNADIAIESQIINATIETEGTSKKYMRLIVKKFLHKSELKEYYRVLSDNEDTLKIKEKKIYEE